MASEPERIWRAGATEAELEDVRRIDADMANMRALLATLAHERQIIANRACQRARYRRQKLLSPDVKISVDE